ncbi:MAG: hypothetical protein ACTSU6_04795 [Candidatus Njordarchaeales archaeon]
MKKILFLVGESGCGKSSLQDSLIQNSPNHYTRITSRTTRDPRPGEIDGVDYHFRSISDFGSVPLLQSDSFGGNFYGTSIEEYNKKQNTGIFVCTPVGITDTIEALKTHKIEIEPIIIFFATTDKQIVSQGADESRIHRGKIREEMFSRMMRNEFDGISLMEIFDMDMSSNLSTVVDVELRRL